MSAKKVKQRSGKRVTQEKAVDSGNLQSAASRRSAEAEVQLLIEKFSPSHLHLIGDMRRWLLKRLPTAHQIVYEYRDCFVISYSPSEHGYEGVFGIRGSEECVRLYFNSGKGLPDTKKLLQGSGGQARYINVEGKATLVRPEVVALVEATIARNQVPFATEGRGTVVIRPTTAQKRRQGGQG